MDLSAALHAFHFLRPYWLLALPPCWGLALWLARRRRKQGNWTSLIDAELLPALRLDSAPRVSAVSPWPWLVLAWSLTALALAGPSWQHEVAPGYRAAPAWVLVLDLSPSMGAADLAPDRATRARYALDDLLSAAHDARVGLVVFSDDAYTVTPLTDDVATVRALLPPLSPGIMPAAGDNLAPALQRAAQLLKRAAARDRRVIVLTDGFADPAAAFGDAQKLKADGIGLSVVGIGTARGAPLKGADGGFAENAQGQTVMTRLDVDRLRQLAASADGNYFGLAQLPQLIGELQLRGERAAGAARMRDVHLQHWRDAGVWLLPVLLLLAAGLSRRGWL
ncbi:MAG TPA: VWA domain-containing protein [Stenotrophobium sp.]|jgi:Ca-activated chloride channel family protein|nr:VWA domain-containing protein [Stenotrophobium sp.]